MSTEAASVADEALRGGRWDDARAAYEAALAVDESAHALEGLGLALRWLEDFPRCFEVQERAYVLYREAGDSRSAGRMATRLGRDNLLVRGDAAVAGGWMARAARLLEAVEHGPEHGWLALRQGQMALYGLHDPQAGEELARTAQEVGARAGDVDLEMAGLSLAGLALVRSGRVQDGMSLLDEATAAAVGGEVRAHDVAGGICCDLIFACKWVQDFERAGQWCVSTGASARSTGHGGLFGICRAHYASVLLHRGDWPAAEAELLEAAELFERAARGLAHEAVLGLAELRLRQGRAQEADELFERVAWHPHAQLGQARAAFALQQPDAAAHRVEAYLRSVAPSDVLGRVGGLALAVELAVERGDEDGAQTAATELEAAAAAGGTAPLGALRDLALARVAAARGEREQACRLAEDAATAWARAGMPFEEACARALLAELHDPARPDVARRERERAAATFRELGCSERAERVEAAGRSSELSARELEVLRLVAAGLSDDEIAERLVLSPHTVHRHVANIRTKLRQSSRAAAAALAVREGLI